MPNYPQIMLYRWFSQLLGHFLEVNPIATVIDLETGVSMTVLDAAEPSGKWEVVYKPDLGVVLNDNPASWGADEQRAYEGICDMIVEAVSDSTLQEVRRDTEEKRSGYARAGVKEYYILDPSDRHMHFFRLTGDGRYVEIQPDDDGVIHSRVLPGFRFRRADLLKKPVQTDLALDEIYADYVIPGHRDSVFRAESAEQRAAAETAARRQAEERATAEAAARRQAEEAEPTGRTTGRSRNRRPPPGRTTEPTGRTTGRSRNRRSSPGRRRQASTASRACPPPPPVPLTPNQPQRRPSPPQPPLALNIPVPRAPPPPQTKTPSSPPLTSAHYRSDPWPLPFQCSSPKPGTVCVTADSFPIGAHDSEKELFSPSSPLSSPLNSPAKMQPNFSMAKGVSLSSLLAFVRSGLFGPPLCGGSAPATTLSPPSNHPPQPV